MYLTSPSPLTPFIHPVVVLLSYVFIYQFMIAFLGRAMTRAVNLSGNVVGPEREIIPLSIMPCLQPAGDRQSKLSDAWPRIEPGLGMLRSLGMVA